MHPCSSGFWFLRWFPIVCAWPSPSHSNTLCIYEQQKTVNAPVFLWFLVYCAWPSPSHIKKGAFTNNKNRTCTPFFSVCLCLLWFPIVCAWPSPSHRNKGAFTNKQNRKCTPFPLIFVYCAWPSPSHRKTGAFTSNQKP